jgi:hypothetical protein
MIIIDKLWLITVARKYVRTQYTTDIENAFLLLERIDVFTQIFLKQYKDEINNYACIVFR